MWRLAIALLLWLLMASQADARVNLLKHYQPRVPSPTYFTKLTTVPAYGLGVVWCGASALMLGTVIVRRELTTAEAWTIAAGCVLPVIGSLIMKRLFELHPTWNIPGKVHYLDLSIASQS